ncbi:MAG TPA: HpcH/HpaI aldolase/citrate lyase family protein, partial [Planctomycetaceae bacterium]|nr:HpcH/HpaI aldolase/citrate lyase family protein [Planctomycetaceae bacterium]
FSSRLTFSMSFDFSDTHYLQLGASLYVPATRGDLVEIANHQRFPALRSVIFCTEDAIAETDVPLALANLRQLLGQLESVGLRRFVRVRSPDVLSLLLEIAGVDRLDGFVLPKLTPHNLADYLRVVPTTNRQWLMPTLETAELFDPSEMRVLRDLLLAEHVRERVICLRIGGNDLLHLLGLRRPRGRTLYETPLGPTISQLVTIFHPAGFSLTSPVFDRLDDTETLAREMRMDVEFGLLGKTAIHPLQIPLIESHYCVGEVDWESARKILHDDAPPVFRHDDAMCEPATHRRWAEVVRDRARIYGVG